MRRAVLSVLFVVVLLVPVATPVLASLGPVSAGSDVADGHLGWIVTLEGSVGPEVGEGWPWSLLGARPYQSFPGWFIPAGPGAAEVLRALPGVARVDANEAVVPHVDRSRTLVRVGDALDVLADAPNAAEPRSPVSVAVIDSGIDVAHPDLRDRVQASVTLTAAGTVPISVDESGHGTRVAGIVAGTGAASPDQRYRGMAPAVGLVAVDLGGEWTVDGEIRAFDWVLENHEGEDIGVVVSSLGRTSATASFDPGDPLVRASDALVDAGIVIVISAGNQGPAVATMANEALNPRVLAVGALSAGGEPAAFTSRGPPGSGKPDVWAPGVDVVSPQATTDTDPARLPPRVLGLLTGSDNGNRAAALYTEATGTSFAAPHVAGALALVRAAFPSLPPETLVSLVRASAVPVPGAEMAVYAHDAAHLAATTAYVAGPERLVPQAIGPDAFQGLRVDADTVFTDQGAAQVTLSLPLIGTAVSEPATLLLPVAVWATGANFTATWDGGTFEATLTDPNGRTVGSPQGGPTARFTLPAGPEPGLWSVEVEPQGALASGTATATVEAHELRPVVGDEALGQAGVDRTSSGDGNGAGFQGLAWMPVALVLGLLLVVAAAVALAMMIGRREEAG